MTGLFRRPISKVLIWGAFDAGNSAHALLVSTVGFALYFREILFKGNDQANSLWALLTVVVLSVSALVSPFLTSWLAFSQRRALGLWLTTVVCVVATMTLGLPLSTWPAVCFYFISAVGYYLALPIYNTYLEEVSDGSPARASAGGWSMGYVGGVVVAVLAFAFGLLSKPITERPDLYRLLFVLAGVFNLLLSVPLMVWASGTEKRAEIEAPSSAPWRLSRALVALRDQRNLVRVLLSYWMVGESGTITIYFTAVFLAQYAKMPAAKIFALTLVLQLIGAFSTWAVGDLSEKYGAKKIYQAVCCIWAVVPILLWLISIGFSYWYALVGIGLVIGAHHVIIRSEVAKITSPMTPEAKGSVFGFLEVTGRITSVLGPLAIAVLTLFVPLANALLIACVFPVLALWAISKHEWLPRRS